MPKEFTDCVKNDGKVVTKKLKGGKYLHICYDKEGNSYSGEVLTKKRESSKIPTNNKKSQKKNNKEVVEGAKATLEDLKRLKAHFDANYR